MDNRRLMGLAAAGAAIADELSDAMPGLPDLSTRRADADRAQARMRELGEQLAHLVAVARLQGTGPVVDAIEALSAGERAVLLAAAVAVMAEASAS